MPLPDRDFNQELDKTRGAAHALEAAISQVASYEYLVRDAQDPSIKGIIGLAQVLADRLDDLCHMNEEEIIEAEQRKMAAVEAEQQRASAPGISPNICELGQRASPRGHQQ